MRLSKIIFVFILMTFFNSLCVKAKVVKDTLYTNDGDRIIVTYDISHTDNQYTVSFKGQRKKLGDTNSSKYHDLSKIAVMFFDRTEEFGGDVTIKNMIPEKLEFSRNVRYKSSSDGYFVVQEYPTLVFAAKDNGEINIPIYLAYHPKKGKYELFAKSEEMKISLNPSSRIVQQSNTTSQVSEHFVSSTTEVETDDHRATLIVLESIKEAKRKLNEEDKLPFSESLQDEIAFLRQQKRVITDRSIVSQINEVLDMYDEKKIFLEEQAEAVKLAAEQEAEAQAKHEEEALQAKNDSINAAQQVQAEKEKKKNLWLIIGGAIFAVLAFVGNQVIQSIRNSRNQKRMMNMQQSIVNKAENEAKKRAQQAVRSAKNRTVSKATNAARTAVRTKTTIKVNGKSKNLSI